MDKIVIIESNWMILFVNSVHLKGRDEKIRDNFEINRIYA